MARVGAAGSRSAQLERRVCATDVSPTLTGVHVLPFPLCHPCAELIVNLNTDRTPTFHLFKLLQAHILPLTNCGFNKSGSRFITGSYDRTCRVWDTEQGTEVLKLEGHKNVVYAISFNNPFGDKIATGSFDKTCKVRA